RDGNGNFYVAWNRRTGNSYYYTWFSRSTDSGLTWTPKMQVHFGRVFSYPAQIVARGAGEVLIGICDDQNNISNLITYTSADSGTTWQSQTPATNYGNNTGFRFFSMAKDASDIIHFVHPYADNGSMLEVRHNRSSDWGGSWSPLTAISDTSYPLIQPGLNQRNSPSVAVSPQGNIYVAWADKRLDPGGDNYEVYLTRSTDGGLTWAPEIQINEMSQVNEQVYPVIALASNGTIDTVSLVWSERRPTNLPPTSFNLYTPQNNLLLAQIDSIDFSWQEPLDPNGDPLSYILRLWESVSPEGAGGALPAAKLVLDTTITGITTTNFRFNGSGSLVFDNQYLWTALVTDGMATVASIDTFNFFTPPAMFNVDLLTPSNGQVLTADTVTFRWQPNIVAANGPLTYTLRLFGSSADTTVSSLSDTSLFFDGSQFFESYRTYQWSVQASDGNLTVSSDTFRVSASPGPMSGIYIIGNTGDFLNFNSAIQALNSFGVDGPLTFKVLPGIYNEKFEINSYPGQGAANPVLFESQNGNASSVNIRYQQSTYNTPIALMDSVSNLTLRKLSFTVLEGSSQHGAIFVRGGLDITIEGCLFSGPLLDPNIYNPFDSHLYSFDSQGLRIQQNEFLGNRQAIFIQGMSSTILTSGVEINHNRINEAARIGMELYYLDAPLVRGNIVEHIGGTAGIYLGYCYNSLKVAKNRIHMKASQDLHTMFGLAIENCNGNSDRGLVVNNMILSSASDSTLRTASLTINNSLDVDIWHNTLHVSGFEEMDIPLQASFGIALRVAPSCYNAMYSADRFLAQWDGTSFSTIESLQAFTGKDANSLSAPPRYYSLIDLHAASDILDGAGRPVLGVIEDIDGDPRDPQSPDIGADEFLPQDIGLQGSFTIGTGGDYPGLGEVVDALHMLGIRGPATFNILAGNYNLPIHFSEIGGTSPMRRVTFQSKSGKTEDVTLSFEQSSQDPNLIRFRDTDFLTFRNLTFHAKLIPSVVGIIRIDRESQGLQFIGNHFNAD
ncbi:MAG: right-handed parallel beta-helix repeat-containing protein, partial [Planctomycetota bacterium]